MNIELINEIRECVHRPLDWNAYTRSLVQEDCNSFSHAIGSTITDVRDYYHLGVLSGNKDPKSKYDSEKEMDWLFLEDLKVLDLAVSKLFMPYGKIGIIDTVPKILSSENENQYVVVMFSRKWPAVKKIADFHFLRYDYGIGWSEKWYGCKLQKISNKNIFMMWPASDHTLVGVYLISR